MTKGLIGARRALPGALIAALVGALVLLGAPSATYGAPPRQPGDPPAAGSDRPGGAHSGHPDNPPPKDSHAAKPGDPGAKPDPNKDPNGKDPNTKNPQAGDKPKDPHAGGDNNAGKQPPKSDDHDAHSGGRDGWYGHYDHDHFGYHGHHNWDTHRHYYRYGYAGPGWYDDCGYYGPNGYDSYYDSPDACDWQYGPQGQSLRADLSGDQEVPGPGAPNAFGTANLFVDMANGRLCYRLGYDGINRPNMAHIHRGGAGQTGPPVIDLHPEVNGDEGCVGSDPTALRNLQEHPEAFYLNLHTPEYPDGAMRGQLFATDRY